MAMTEVERKEYNEHWQVVTAMARMKNPAKPRLFALAWRWRWQRIAELEAEPYNPCR